MNLRLSKTFGFGREVGAGQVLETGQGGGGPVEAADEEDLPEAVWVAADWAEAVVGRVVPSAREPTTSRRYNLTFSVSARNIFNRVNLSPPIGNLSSPLFGESNTLAGGPYSFGSATRRIDLQALFSF